MLIDCFTFFNELDMLEYRLHTLCDTVDWFVLVEAAYTHKGAEKPFYYEENKERFAKFHHKIIHVKVYDMPNTANAWDNENHQRRCIGRGLEQLNLKSSDLLIISDVDEIPNKKKLQDLCKRVVQDPVSIFASLLMDMYYYTLNCKIEVWGYTRVLTYDLFCSVFNKDAQVARMLPPTLKSQVPYQDIEDAGWHLSYFGNSDFIQNKLNHFGHQEFNTPELNNKEVLSKCIEYNFNFVTRKQIPFLALTENPNLPTDLQLLLKYFPAR